MEEKEDPALRAKYNEHKAQIDLLTAEVRDATARVAELRIDDPSHNLEGLEEKKNSLVEERKKLEEELAELKEEHRDAISKLEEYKKKYSLQSN